MEDQEELLQKEVDILAEMEEILQKKVDKLTKENNKITQELQRKDNVEELPMYLHLPDGRMGALRIKKKSNTLWQVTYLTKGHNGSYYDIVIITTGSTLESASYRMKKKIPKFLSDFKPEKVKPENKIIWVDKVPIQLEPGIIAVHRPPNRIRLTINYVADTLELCKLQILKGIQIMRRFIQKNNTKS